MKSTRAVGHEPAPPAAQIVCGTDFSIHAAEAANAAAAIARRWRIPLVLVHVLDDPATRDTPKARGQLRKSLQEKLDLEAVRLKDGKLEIQTEVLEGRPEVELARVAARPESRLLVTGSLGHVGVSRILIGSVAERAAETAPVPTLVVRDAKRLIEWAEGRRDLTVFVGGDFTASADGAIRWVRELQSIGPCQIVVGHAPWPAEARRRLGGLTSPSPLTRNPPELEHILERDLRAKVNALLGVTSVRIRITPSWGAPGHTLLQMAHEEQADLIVVGAHQRHGLSRLAHPSVSRAILHHAPMNVACVPATLGATPPTSQIHRVLVATDFSERANHAIPLAYSVVSPGGLVQLLHVVPPFENLNPWATYYGKSPKTKQEYGRLTRQLITQLEGLVPPEAKERGIGSSATVVAGRNVAAIVCQEAARWGANLICLGSHGHSGLKAAVLGSVAQRIIAKSDRPVLVARLPVE
jgi:nucleotide-binding universal stress UspA family protein